MVVKIIPKLKKSLALFTLLNSFENILPARSNKSPMINF